MIYIVIFYKLWTLELGILQYSTQPDHMADFKIKGSEGNMSDDVSDNMDPFVHWIRTFWALDNMYPWSNMFMCSSLIRHCNLYFTTNFANDNYLQLIIDIYLFEDGWPNVYAQLCKLRIVCKIYNDTMLSQTVVLKQQHCNTLLSISSWKAFSFYGEILCMEKIQRYRLLDSGHTVSCEGDQELYRALTCGPLRSWKRRIGCSSNTW